MKKTNIFKFLNLKTFGKDNSIILKSATYSQGLEIVVTAFKSGVYAQFKDWTEGDNALKATVHFTLSMFERALKQVRYNCKEIICKDEKIFVSDQIFEDLIKLLFTYISE